MRNSFLAVTAALLLLAGCAQAPAHWDAADVRLLDPPDDAATPETDIVALYARAVSEGQQVRVDFLDLQDIPPERVYLAFDTGPGGRREIPGTQLSADLAWDWLISIPGSLTPRLNLPDGSLPARLTPEVSYDFAQDSLTLTLPPGLLPNKFQIQALAVSDDRLSDSTAVVAADAHPPARAPLLLSFSDVLPAASAATALRHWDGAHTGPYGERHGLHPLLEAAASDHVPLVLLDLLRPRSLSTLDLVGGLRQIRQLQTDGSVMLAESDLGDPPYPEGIGLDANREAAKRFGLIRSDLVYALSPQPNEGYQFQFTPFLNDLAHLERDDNQGLTLVPLPLSDDEQVDPQGPTLETRRELLAAALSPDPADLVNLGGSLPASAWGDSDVAEAAMAYISAHPWIAPLNLQGLSRFQTTPGSYQPEGPPPASYDRYTSAGASAGMDSGKLTKELGDRINQAPSGTLRDAAWDMFASLADPGHAEDSGALAAQYLGEVGVVVAANAWAQAPGPQATCDVDLDYDTVSECVLANDRLFAVFEGDGGRLGWLFSVKHGQPHQLVGGTQQFQVGLSDHSRWQIERGPAADPGQIPGAFVDADSPWSPYEVRSLGPDSLILASQDGSREKSFRLLPDGVSAQYRLKGPVQTRFALALDPWRRFDPGWGTTYYSRQSADRVTWQVSGGASVTIQAPGQLGLAAFNDTLDSLSGPEDPNQEFPPGHYLPFPMAVADYSLEDGCVVELSVK